MKSVRFVPLGGIIGVTKNMYLYETYEDNNLQSILIVDCGIGFPKEQNLGIDHEIPDITYLKDKTQYIRAVLLTHGHEDHISALRYHYRDLGMPPVFGSQLTTIFVQHKFKEHNVPLTIYTIRYNEDYDFGDMKARFIHTTHSIPDTTHILIKTPVGNFYHGSDFKFDLTPPYENPPDMYETARAGQEGVLCLLSDSLGAGREGLTLSESIVSKTFEDEMRTTKGIFVMTTFASNISRVRQCAEVALKFNRKICLLGRSMIDTAKLIREFDYLPIPRSSFIDARKVRQERPNHICVIATGAQGQYNAALSKLATKQNPHITLTKGDKVVFSSDPIPGNEDNVYDVIESLYLSGVEVRYSDVQEQLHASGHGSQEDLKLLMLLTKPKYLIPIGGTVRHQRHYLNLAQQIGHKEKDVFLLKEGETMIFSEKGAAPGAKVETKNVYVDSYGVGSLNHEVLRDRRTLSTDGIVVMIMKVDPNYQLVGQPECFARGLVDSQSAMSEKLIAGAIQKATDAYKKQGDARVRQTIIRALEQYFYKQTNKQPIICVEYVGV